MEGESHETSRFMDVITGFKIEEATIEDIQLAFKQNNLTSRQLVDYYLDAYKKLNPSVRAVIEVNPDAQAQADEADRNRNLPGGYLSGMHGIPVILKDNIDTKDKLQTTSGSCILLNSIVPRDSGVIDRLRKVGAIILGKAGLTEWAGFRSFTMPTGWNARQGRVVNPYKLTGGDPGGSSAGSAVTVAANLVTVSIGTETSGSIVDPCNLNCVVGIKPTVSLTSRAGVIPISLRQDSVGSIGRTVSDAVYLLDEIVGYDSRDEITKQAIQYIPAGGFKQCLKNNGLNGKRLGNLWHYWKGFYIEDFPEKVNIFERHFNTIRENGAVLEDDLAISNWETVMNDQANSMLLALKYELKRDLNIYFSNLLQSPIRSLADAIKANMENEVEEHLAEYGQHVFIESEATTLPDTQYTESLTKMAELSTEGFEKFMKDNNLDAAVLPEVQGAFILAMGGYPEILVPAGFDDDVPFGIMFVGLKGSDAKLIEIAYAFEQATKIRKPPPLLAT